MTDDFEIENGIHESVILERYHGSDTHVVIPDGVTDIWHSFYHAVFERCENLISVVIPDSVKRISKWSFLECRELVSIVIPDSVISIDKDAFEFCDKMTIICSEGSFAHQYCIKNHRSFFFDYQYEAFHGLIPPEVEMLSSPFLADEEKPFIFISYSHKDRERVLPILKMLYESGWKIWYDEGLTIGDSYDETLEKHVRNCSAFLLFVTENSLNSLYIEKNEAPWAIRFEKPIVKCILDDGENYEIIGGRVIATVSPSMIEPALETIDGLTKGECREAKGISVAVDPSNRRETSNGDGFAYCLYAPQSAATAKAILLETKNGGCTLYDAVENGADEERLQSAACLIVFLDKAFLSDHALTKLLIEAYHAEKNITVCRLEDIETDDYPQELSELDKMHALNFVHGITPDMNKNLVRHLQKRGCRNTSILPGFEYKKSEKGIVIIRYTGMDPNPRIESEYGGVPVIGINERAFKQCVRLKSIVIPNSVTSIGDSAFEGCLSLTSIVIPDRLKRIGYCTFYNCTNLRLITLPNGVKKIGANAFKNCTNLTSVIIPKTVTEIDAGAFINCTNLTSILIPDSVKVIGSYAFLGCTNLKSVTVSNSVTKIESKTFKGCTSLTSITIPNGVTKIESEAFVGCAGLVSVTIPDSVTIIGEAAFNRCTSLSSVTIPDSVNEIQRAAFMDCSSLISVTIPDSVKILQRATFMDCFSLTSVTIPNCLTIIGEEAFKGCSSLTSVTLPDSVKILQRGAFMQCSSLISVTISDYVTVISQQAFKECTSLTSITILNSETKIIRYAFDFCPNLTVTCPRFSYAWKFCKENDIPVKSSGFFKKKKNQLSVK